MKNCNLCKKSSLISEALPFCIDCIRGRFQDIKSYIEEKHRASRKRFNLPENIPKDGEIKCVICVNKCSMAEGERGYCGIPVIQEGHLYHRAGNKKRAILQWYYDSLPTNCVADWVCPGCTGSGFPKYAYRRSAEFGYKNLAVFYEACNFNCLFCQNWHYKYNSLSNNYVSSEELAAAVDEKTSCICFFGGDPAPQLLHSLQTCRVIKTIVKDRPFRFCWETNGSENQNLLKVIADLAFESGGCIKIDLKAYDKNLHKALTGSDNSQTIQNIKFLSSYIEDRREVPFLVVSTLLIPGYIDLKEIYSIASYLASLNKDIPYALLAFYPQFYFSDLPITSRKQAIDSYEVAKKAGLTNVKIGNLHLL